MLNLPVRSLRHSPPMATIFSVAVVVVVFAVVGGSSSAPPPSKSPPFLQFQTEVVEDRQPEMVAQPVVEEEEDYPIWNPTPYFDGGWGGAPIPHARAACCPHLPCCSNFQQQKDAFANSA